MTANNTKPEIAPTESKGVNTIPVAKTRTFDPGDGGAPFRCGVGLIIINTDGHCLAFERRLQRGEWQWPQGGINNGEDLTAAAYRELHEEAGIMPEDVELLLQLPEATFYTFPDYIASRPSPEGPKYRGQRHDWFVFLFKGDTAKLRFDNTDEVEFIAHRWTPLADMTKAIVGFKQSAYQQVIDHLTPHIDGWRSTWQAR